MAEVMQKGKINVQTEDIFPIIKKFLYSENEIFLRELISNAVDATQKLRTLSRLGKFKGELGDLTIHVEVDKEKKTLTVRDRGIGMTAEEVDKYINQIAFSSAEEFLKKFKGKSDEDKSSIIGHFGLGFYSTFMVSKKVEIITKTYKKGGPTRPVRWECQGTPDFTIKETDKADRGTEIILHMADDSLEYLEEHKVLEILKKYSKFMPIPIQFGTETVQEKIEGEKDEKGEDKYESVEKPRIINNPEPAWTKKPADLKEEDYKSFYRELYPYSFEEPLFHIHLNVDYPFNLTGILYFPKVKKNIEVQRDKIQLYSNQVFVTDSVEGIVPDFLTLLHGVLDSPDIPLNVSRSYLQGDPNVKKISNHIMKKVADKLEELFKNDRKGFEKKWEDIKVFIEYGMISEPKFYERAEKFSLLKNTDGEYFTFDEYKKKIEKTQKDKDNKLVYLYANDKDEQFTYIKGAKEKGYDVLEMDGMIDNHFINTLETKFSDTSFARVDSDTIDKLIKKDDEIPSKLNDDDKKKVKEIFEKYIEKEKYNVVTESMSEKDDPVIITRPEFMRRMKDMSALGGGMGYMGEMPDQVNLAINENHSLTGKILGEKDEKEQEQLVKQLTDLALLAQNMLKGAKLNDFVKRSLNIID